MGDSESEAVLKDLFLRDKPAEMLVFLKRGDKPNYATEVSKGVDCTYSHTIKVLNKFEELGLVEFEKKGRIKLIKLTADGEDISHDLEGLMRKFKRFSEGGSEKEDEKKSEDEEKNEDSEN
ncbi:MAG: winged helix DNA-binding protein [Candidatus Aenigmatarchaeota archaeon]